MSHILKEMAYIWLKYHLNLNLICNTYIRSYNPLTTLFMAILKDGLQFTGSVGNLTAYTMKGTDKIVVRRKSGPSKEKIKKAPNFAKTRENNVEFGLCAQIASGIRASLWPLKHMAGYNFTPTLIAMAKHVQQLDTTSERGKRKVLFSQHRHLLEGFNLNKINQFNSVLRHPLACSIDRTGVAATVNIPQLVPGMNIFLPWQQPVYRIVAAFGFMCDDDATAEGHAVSTATDWHPSHQPFERTTLSLDYARKGRFGSDMTMILSIGIEMGTPISDHFVQPFKNHAAAKILATG